MSYICAINICLETDKMSPPLKSQQIIISIKIFQIVIDMSIQTVCLNP